MSRSACSRSSIGLSTGLAPVFLAIESRLSLGVIYMGGFYLQLWANGVAYPILISGKPVFNWQPYMPVTFELGVLLAAISTVVGMLAFNELPMLFHPLFGSRAFAKRLSS